ncbi:hypothetical protein SteCoe_22863 [Stentor coeruleus]|uniref:Protein kinase domain-containing protein n=1 Tax=Stentor coeruleus TaxID=5963 RepID=A0A1R2BL93_9CILI|nr:hypothetical protein SteCoe_22863 [Stentor coeruleus]
MSKSEMIKAHMENKRGIEENTRRNDIDREENTHENREDTRFIGDNEKNMGGNTRKIEKDRKNNEGEGLTTKGNIRNEEKIDIYDAVEEDSKNEEHSDEIRWDTEEYFSDDIPNEIEESAHTLPDKMQKILIPLQMLEINKDLPEKAKNNVMSSTEFLGEVTDYLDIDMTDILEKFKGINKIRRLSELTNFTNEVREVYKKSEFEKTKNKLKILYRILKLLKFIASQNYEEFIEAIEKLQQSDKDLKSFDLSLHKNIFLIELKAFIDMKDYDKAIEHLGKLENFHIDDKNMIYEIYFYTSKLIRAMGYKEDANTLLSNVSRAVANNIDLNILDARLRLEMANVYLQEENHMKALALAQEVRELNLPEFGIFENVYELIRIFTLLGHLEIKMRNYNQGFKDFTKAREFSDKFYDEDTVVAGLTKFYTADTLLSLVLGDKRQEITMMRENIIYACLEDAGILYKESIPILSKFLNPLSLELAEAYLSIGIFYFTISDFVLSLKYLSLCKNIFTSTQTFNYNFQYLCKWLNLLHKNFGNSKSSLKTQAFAKSDNLAKVYYKSKSSYQIKNHISKINSNIITIIKKKIDYNYFLADYGAFISYSGKIIQFIRIKTLKAIEFINIYKKSLMVYKIFLMIIAWHEPDFVMFEWHEKLFQYKIEDPKTVDEKSFSFWDFNMSFAKVMMGLIKLGVERKFIGLLKPDSFVVNQKKVIKIFACCEEDLKNMESWEGFLISLGIESMGKKKQDCKNCNKEAEECVNCENKSFRNHDIEDPIFNRSKQIESSFNKTKSVTVNNFVPPEFIFIKSNDCKISLEAYYTFSFSLIILSFLDRNFKKFIEEEYADLIFHNQNTKEFDLIVRKCLERQNLNPLIKKIIIKTLKFDYVKRISPEKILRLLDYYLINKNNYGINFD